MDAFWRLRAAVMIPGRFLVAGIAILGAITCLAAEAEPKTAFLRERKVITTKTGVIGIDAGTRVIVVGHHGDLVIVRANDQEFEVGADQLTSDSEAAALLQREQRQQELVEKEAAERELRYKESLLSEQKAKKEEAKKRKPAGGTAPDDQLEEIRAKREALKTELNKIKLKQIGLLPADTSSQARQKLRQRRKEIEHELIDLDQREQRLKSQSR